MNCTTELKKFKQSKLQVNFVYVLLLFAFFHIKWPSVSRTKKSMMIMIVDSLSKKGLRWILFFLPLFRLSLWPRVNSLKRNRFKKRSVSFSTHTRPYHKPLEKKGEKSSQKKKCDKISSSVGMQGKAKER